MYPIRYKPITNQNYIYLFEIANCSWDIWFVNNVNLPNFNVEKHKKEEGRNDKKEDGNKKKKKEGINDKKGT
jgi:hypothetical protein